MGFAPIVLPPAWESAVDGWLNHLRETGASESTIGLRRRHVRSIARLTRTAAPRHVTSDALRSIYREQRWAFNYRCDVRTSVSGFYDWAIETGLVASNPMANLVVV